MYLPFFVVGIASVAAAATDISKFKVYNALTYPLLISGLVYQVTFFGVSGFADGMIAIALAFSLMLYPYLWGAFGAGDVKFVAAVGAWLGYQLMLPVFLLGCLATGVYALALLFMHQGYQEAWTNLQIAMTRIMILGRQIGADEPERVQTVAQQSERRKRLIPFSAMITLGIFVTFVWMNFVK